MCLDDLDRTEQENERNRSSEEVRHQAIRHSTESAPDRRARRLAGEYDARSAVDQACRHFAAHGRWPALDNDATLYAHDRWIWAMWFSGWLDDMSPLAQQHSREEWLE